LLTLWIIGSIVWVLVLFFFYPIFVVASRADEYEETKYRHAEDTLIVEESAREVEKMIPQYR
jgi:beta-lactamase regulating signal transducer with metallopeptidase domain